MAGEPSIADDYMEYARQFGYIVLFSAVFPLAAVVCLAANFVLLRSVMNEFEYKRRNMPEISIGIGKFLVMFEFLSHLCVVVNAAILYFESDRLRELYVLWLAGPDEEYLRDPTLLQTEPFSAEGFDPKRWIIMSKDFEAFVVYVVFVEHCLFALQFLC